MGYGIYLTTLTLVLSTILHLYFDSPSSIGIFFFIGFIILSAISTIGPSYLRRDELSNKVSILITAFILSLIYSSFMTFLLVTDNYASIEIDIPFLLGITTFVTLALIVHYLSKFILKIYFIQDDSLDSDEIYGRILEHIGNISFIYIILMVPFGLLGVLISIIRELSLVLISLYAFCLILIVAFFAGFLIIQIGIVFTQLGALFVYSIEDEEYKIFSVYSECLYLRNFELNRLKNSEGRKKLKESKLNSISIILSVFNFENLEEFIVASKRMLYLDSLNPLDQELYTRGVNAPSYSQAKLMAIAGFNNFDEYSTAKSADNTLVLTKSKYQEKINTFRLTEINHYLESKNILSSLQLSPMAELYNEKFRDWYFKRQKLWNLASLAFPFVLLILLYINYILNIDTGLQELPLLVIFRKDGTGTPIREVISWPALFTNPAIFLGVIVVALVSSIFLLFKSIDNESYDPERPFQSALQNLLSIETKQFNFTTGNESLRLKYEIFGYGIYLITLTVVLSTLLHLYLNSPSEIGFFF
ncbi:MAG: hypothetical protein ACXAC7_21370, partial [Candidatus Hodarchaeales archaeon]